MEVTIKALKERLREKEQAVRTQAHNLAEENQLQLLHDYAEKERCGPVLFTGNTSRKHEGLCP